MKNLTKLIMACMLFLSQSCCFYDDCEDDPVVDPVAVSEFEPVFLTRSELNNSVSLENPQEISSSGKIYVKDNLLFVSEVRKGFHVFDNSNPRNPQKIKFIAAPGSTDLAIRDNVLYINQATDLIAANFNLSSNMLVVTKRVEDIFPELLSPDGYYAYDIPQNSIVVEWKPKN